jgi:hypothetical protein
MCVCMYVCICRCVREDWRKYTGAWLSVKSNEDIVAIEAMCSAAAVRYVCVYVCVYV